MVSTDVHSSDIRSKNMAAIKSRDTSPELIVRKTLHVAGYRYRLHARNLPGSPDLVFLKYRAVLFINGCFWHKHECHLFRLPKTRTEFWNSKLSGTAAKDNVNLGLLRDLSWRTGTIWECSLRGKTRLTLVAITDIMSEWLKSDRQSLEI